MTGIPTEVMRIIEAGLEGDAERVRKCAEHWSHNLLYAGDAKSADRLRRLLAGDPPARRVTLDQTAQ